MRQITIALMIAMLIFAFGTDIVKRKGAVHVKNSELSMKWQGDTIKIDSFTKNMVFLTTYYFIEEHGFPGKINFDVDNINSAEEAVDVFKGREGYTRVLLTKTGDDYLLHVWPVAFLESVGKHETVEELVKNQLQTSYDEYYSEE